MNARHDLKHDTVPDARVHGVNYIKVISRLSNPQKQSNGEDNFVVPRVSSVYPSGVSIPGKTARRKFLFIIAGTFRGLAVFEGALQIAALAMSFATSHRMNRENPGGLPFVAFVGDSNIYGLYVEPHQTVARAVERLSVVNEKPTIHCVNLGVPSSPS